MTVGVRIWRATEGDCRCPGPYSADEVPTCRHWWECKWGRLTNTEADPRRGLQPLMAITPDTATRLLQAPEPAKRGEGTIRATEDSDRVFVHYDSTDGHRTTWELFGAYFVDKPDFRILIGRWPD